MEEARDAELLLLQSSGFDDLESRLSGLQVDHQIIAIIFAVGHACDLFDLPLETVSARIKGAPAHFARLRACLQELHDLRAGRLPKPADATIPPDPLDFEDIYFGHAF